MATGDVLLARLNARFCGEPVINNFAMVDVGSGGDDFQQTSLLLRDALFTTFDLANPAGVLLGGLNVQYSLETLDILDVVPGTAPMQRFAVGAVGAVDDDDAMPPNDALCVTWRSLFKGPSGRGRVYLTGFSEGAANGGFWEAGTQTYANDLAATILDSHGEDGTSSFRFVVLHRQTGGAPIVPPEQKPVMGYTVHNEVRSLGRRAVGRRIRRHRVTP